MGFLKIIGLVALPIAGMSYAAFSLGKQLPKAARLFGNYVGLSYVYFKVILKTLKPQDQMPYQMMQMARKASQQSQALRRQLRTTFKKAKDDLNKKHQETLSKFQQKINSQQNEKQNKQIKKVQQRGKRHQQLQSGSILMLNIAQTRKKIIQQKKQKKNSRKFFNQL